MGVGGDLFFDWRGQDLRAFHGGDTVVFGILFDDSQILVLPFAGILLRRLGGSFLVEDLLYDLKVIIVYDIEIVLHELIEFSLDPLEL